MASQSLFLSLYVMFASQPSATVTPSCLDEGGVAADHDEDGHADPPTPAEALTSLGLLIVSLVSVVGHARLESPAIEAGRC